MLALVWILFILCFFTLSTTQEYYSLPIYPALAMLLGSHLATRKRYPKVARVVRGWSVRAVPRRGGVSAGVDGEAADAGGHLHCADAEAGAVYAFDGAHERPYAEGLCVSAAPLVVAGCALLIGVVGLVRVRRAGAAVAVLVVMMLVFLQAARLALVTFDPYLSSYRLAEALERSPAGELIEGDAYYAFSATFFYTNRTALLWNGRSANLE